MYSETHYYVAQGGCPKIETPSGQRVAVIVLRERGFKLSYAQLAAVEPIIGYIRRIDGHPAGSGMAYRTHSMLKLTDGASTERSLAHLNNPCLFDWNRDGVIYEGWVLERNPADGKMQQVVQMWWIRNLEVMSEKPEIKPFHLHSGQRSGQGEP